MVFVSSLVSLGLVSSFSSLALWYFLSGGGGGGGGVVFHKCLSAFCPPLFSVPLVISPLAFLPFLRSSCSCLFLSLFLRCLQLLHLFLRWLRPPPLASLLLSLCLLPRGSWYLRSPFLRCLDLVGGGGCICGVLHRYCLRLL